MRVNVVGIVSLAYRNQASAAWEALGRGPNNFSTQLTTDSPSQLYSPITHYMMADSSATDTDAAGWQDIAASQIGSENLQIYVADASQNPFQHVISVLTQRSLQRFPAGTILVGPDGARLKSPDGSYFTQSDI